ncbi:MAG: hypothetical protein ACLGSA_08920 [Acidobacteriota bacterium]
MEDLLRELITVNKEMLNEIRQLRYSLERAGQAAPKGAGAVFESPSQVRDLKPIFGQNEEISEPGRTPPPRYTPEDLEDIRGSLMEGLKKRNKAKSNAFTEFEKRHKDW